jgi:hypothetical protein
VHQLHPFELAEVEGALVDVPLKIFRILKNFILEIDRALQVSLAIHPRKQINPQTLSAAIHYTKMTLNPLPLDIWYEILVLLDIKEAIALSKAHPRFFGAFIESKQVIRFRNAINSYKNSSVVDLPVGPLASFIRSVMCGSSLKFSSLFSWLARRFRSVRVSL